MTQHRLYSKPYYTKPERLGAASGSNRLILGEYVLSSARTELLEDLKSKLPGGSAFDYETLSNAVLRAVFQQLTFLAQNTDSPQGGLRDARQPFALELERTVGDGGLLWKADSAEGAWIWKRYLQRGGGEDLLSGSFADLKRKVAAC